MFKRSTSVRAKAMGLGAMGLVIAIGYASFAGGQGRAERSVSQGRGRTATANMFACPAVANARMSPVGTVKALDGSEWPAPAANAFQTGPKAADLYNECSGFKPQTLAEVAEPPVVVVDPDGEVITGYLIADNYFELYVNGKLVAVDPVTFTPFNSSVVRFRAKRPVTYAVKLIDWEETLGLGTEKGRGGDFHPGDGGFVARFTDGTVTDRSWRAQSFYIAPLASPDDVVERGAVHDTTKLGRTYPAAPDQAACGERCYAVRYLVPASWAAKGFDDSVWPQAEEFSEQEMGIDRLPAFTNFRGAFAGSRVIWSSNLVYDNLVLARKVGR